MDVSKKNYVFLWPQYFLSLIVCVLDSIQALNTTVTQILRVWRNVRDYPAPSLALKSLSGLSLEAVWSLFRHLASFMCPDSLSVTPGSHMWGLVPPWGIVDMRHFCFLKEQIFPYLMKSTILPLSLPFWDKTFSAIQRLVNFLKDFFRLWPFKIIPKVLTQNLKMCSKYYWAVSNWMNKIIASVLFPFF